MAKLKKKVALKNYVSGENRASFLLSSSNVIWVNLVKWPPNILDELQYKYSDEMMSPPHSCVEYKYGEIRKYINSTLRWRWPPNGMTDRK